MIIKKEHDRYYKVYYNGNLSDQELSRFLFINKLRFVSDLGKGLSFDHCVLAIKI